MATLISGLGGAAGYGEGVFSTATGRTGNLDDGSLNVNLTSVFGASGLNLYGTAYTSVFINTNGLLTFGTAEPAYTSAALTTLGQPSIAPFWTDIDINKGGEIYWDLDPATGKFIVTWLNVAPYTGTGTNSFQAVFTNLGGGDFNIEYIYGSIGFVNGGYGNATVGISNGTSSQTLVEGSNDATFLATYAGNDFDTQDPAGVWSVAYENGAVFLGDGVVEGTAGNDLIDINYTGDLEGDRIDRLDATGASGTTGDADVVMAGAGNDTVQAGIGNDIVYGGSGNDQITLAQGNDWADGGTEADSIDGGSGNDSLYGGGGNDTLLGGADSAAVTYTAAYSEVTLATATGTQTITGSSGRPNFGVRTTSNETLTIGTNGTLTGYYLGDVNSVETHTHAATSQITGGQIQFNGISGIETLTINIDGVVVNLTTAIANGSVTFNGAGVYQINGSGQIVRIGGGATNTTIGTLTINVPYTSVSLAGTGNTTSPGLWYRYFVNTQPNNVVAASGGNDLLYGGDGDDFADGGNGNDSIFGDAGNDSLLCNDGNDSVYGGAGADTLSGGIGDDRLEGGADNDSLIGGTGNDTLLGDDGNDTLNGDDGNDSLSGGLGNDVLSGGIGNDTLAGGDGNDTLNGGDNADLLNGDLGDDLLNGDTGEDTLSGGDGNDALYGGADNDTLNGDAGNDQLFGDAGNDSLLGSTGADTLSGGIGDDRLEGGVDNDSLSGGTGNDTLLGDDGDDTLNGDDGNDSLSGGIGNDLLSGGLGNDTLAGGNGNDTLNGGDNADLLNGDLGDDLLNGDAGTDTLSGGDGNDVLNGGADNDTLNGDAGDDQLFGDSGNDSLAGGVGNDTLYGGIGNDILWSDTGNDLIYGGDGNDNITSGTGNDTIIGDLGSDTINADQGMDWVDYSGSNAGVTVDLVAGTGAGGHAAGDLLFGVDALLGSAFDDVLLGFDGFSNNPADAYTNVFFGNAGNDYLDGRGGDDSLYGGADNDTVLGGAGADLVDGGIGQDSLLGEAGNDTVLGGAGNDWLNGGAGADSIDGGIGNDTIVVGTGTEGYGDTVVGGENTGDNDVLDLTAWGWALTNIIYDPMNPENGTVEFLDGSGAVIGSMSFTGIETVIPCFTPGTMITTQCGEVLVEDLQAGDLVMTRDNGLQPLRWVGRRQLSLADLIVNPALRPVEIAKGALGHDLPIRDMKVSPQHRMLIEDGRAEMLFGDAEVLVAATHLRVLPGIEERLTAGVTYIHLLFDRHELICANGAWTESFQPAMRMLNGMEEAQRAEIAALFPEIAGEDFDFPAARLSLKAHEARVLLQA